MCCNLSMSASHVLHYSPHICNFLPTDEIAQAWDDAGVSGIEGEVEDVVNVLSGTGKFLQYLLFIYYVCH